METLEQRYELYVEMTKRFEPAAYVKTFDEWLNS